MSEGQRPWGTATPSFVLEGREECGGSTWGGHWTFGVYYLRGVGLFFAIGMCIYCTSVPAFIYSISPLFVIGTAGRDEPADLI